MAAMRNFAAVATLSLSTQYYLNPRFMVFPMSHIKFFISCCCLVLSSISVLAKELDLMGGFEIGSTFNEAEQYAISRGWRLKPLPDMFPNEWAVNGSEFGLFICDNKVLAIRKSFLGNLDDFATITWQLQLKLGKPHIQITSLKAGKRDISTVDARFQKKDSGISVQIQSIDGEIRVSTNSYSRLQCNE